LTDTEIFLLAIISNFIIIILILTFLFFELNKQKCHMRVAKMLCF